MTNYYIEMLKPIVAHFIIERLWSSYSSRNQTKENFINSINEAIKEINYNCKAGVGNTECNFRIDAHKILSKEKSLDKETASFLIDIIDAAQLCNSYGRRRHVKPGHVKTWSQALRNQLTKLH